MMLLRIVFAFALLMFGLTPAFAKRVALLIGNSAYSHVAALNNPKNDASLMAEVLKEAGFDVTLLLDLDQRAMKKAMVSFGRKLKEGADASMFYYAGHGIEINGVNYLVPTDSNMESKDEADLMNISLNAFLAQMEGSGVPLNIIVLDACRNNPFRSLRSVSGGGLAPVNAPSGTYVAYATAPGSVAVDGVGNNSPFTKALAESIREPGLALETVFKRTREKVKLASKGEQLPFDSSAITGEFYFLKDIPQLGAKKEQATLEQGDFAPDKVIMQSCRMDVCGWMVVRERDQMIVNPSNRVLRVKYSNGVSGHKLPDVEGNELDKQYPDKFSPSVQVDWDPEESEVFLLCSKSLPALAHVNGKKLDISVLDLAGGSISGYQVSDAVMYAKLCFDADYFKTSSEQFRGKYGIHSLLKFDENDEQELAKKAERIIRQHGKSFLK